ncbi:hypothetical protein [Treponema sp. R6D11]
MANKYITANGFERPTFAEIKNEMVTEFRNIFGVAIDTDPTTPMGHLIDLLSLKFYDVWEAMQEIYTGFSPSMATGFALDILADLYGIRRGVGTRSNVEVYLFGKPDALPVQIPAGKQVAVTEALTNKFELTSPKIIATTFTKWIAIKKKGNWSAPLNIQSNSVNPPIQATGIPNDITLQALAHYLNTTFPNSGVQFVYYANPDPRWSSWGVNINEECIVIERLSNGTLDLALQGFDILGIATTAQFIATVDGPVRASQQSIHTILTPVSGWVGVNNTETALPGILRESDEALRIRRMQTFTRGYATLPNMEFQILNGVLGINFCRVVENLTGDILDGMLPGGIKVMIAGAPNEEELARKIWEVKPAGAPLFGARVIEITDSHNQIYQVRFEVPSVNPIWLKIQYERSEESLPPSDEWTPIANAIIEAWHNQNNGMGVDLVGDRFAIPIYQAVPLGNIRVYFTDQNPSTTTNPNWVRTFAVDPSVFYAIQSINWEEVGNGVIL